MKAPSPHTREFHKILRLIGALIIASGAMILLNQLVGDGALPTTQDGQYLRMQMPLNSPPVRLIEA